MLKQLNCDCLCEFIFLNEYTNRNEIYTDIYFVYQMSHYVLGILCV